MSNRSKKSSSTFSNINIQKTSTPIGASFRSMSGSNRPPSPTVLSRLQEKNELAGLNDRLAIYVEKVRSLEVDNSRLTNIVNTKDTSEIKEVTKIKDMFEDELKTVRRLLDDISKDKARFQIENSSLKKELAEMRDQYHSKDAEVVNLERKFLTGQSQLSEAQARLNDAVSQKNYWEDESKKLKRELEGLEKSMADLKRSLEEEAVSRVDLENRLQSVREAAVFQDQLHQQELSETSVHSRVEFEQVDQRLQVEYDSRLREILHQLRSENDENIHSMRVETEALFEKKYGDLREAMLQSEGLSEKTLCEIRSLKKRAEEQLSENDSLNKLVHNYKLKIRELEGKLQMEKDDHEASVEALMAQIRSLKQTIEDQIMEYRDLMDMKIKLDNEILTYRNLMEVEESRQKGIKFRYSSPLNLEGSRKRKRMDFGAGDSIQSDILGSTKETNAVTSNIFNVSSSRTDVVKFHEVCPEGKFVRLVNDSKDKELSVGGWLLKLKAGEVETVYKFHRNQLFKPDSTITVWSADTDKIHSPPSDLLMKGQSWKLGDEVSGTLVDQKGEQVALCEMRKTTSSSFSESSSQQNPSKGWLSFLGLLV